MTSARLALAQEGITIDSFRVMNEKPGFVDVELTGSNDGATRPLCLGAVARSKDGDVRSDGYQPVGVPAHGQFQIVSRVLRPEGSKEQHTDLLLVQVYRCGQDVILNRKLDWSYAWRKTNEAPGAANYSLEMSLAHPWKAFQWDLVEEDFEALDRLVKKWNDPRERDENGEWKLDGFRDAFVNYGGGKRDWRGDLQRIKKWREFNPKSAGAAIAEARYWAAYARQIRGDDANTEADPVAIEAFAERMQRAEQALQDSRDYAADNPLWYETYLDIAIATQRDDKFVASLFNEAVGRHPYFQPLYLAMASRWAPRSGEGGSWGKVDEVISQAVANTYAVDGAGNYAMLYVQLSELQECECQVFGESHASWPKIRDALEDLVQRYPSADNLNAFAALACRAGDRKAFLSVRPRVINRIVPEKWLRNYSYDLCDHRFMQGA